MSIVCWGRGGGGCCCWCWSPIPKMRASSCWSQPIPCIRASRIATANQ
jgi:hypothetical protein